MKTVFHLAPALLALALAATTVRAQNPVRGDTVPRPRTPLLGTVAGDTARAGTVRVCAGGDVTLGTNLNAGWVHTASRKYGIPVEPFPDPDSLVAPLRPLVADADVVLLNVEGAIGDGPPSRRKCAPGSTACFAFRMQPEAAGALRRVADGAEVVGNVANNHAGDAGRPGWRDTMSRLRAAGVHVTGADTVPTVVVTARGDTVAFLGFSVWIGPDARDLAAVRRIVGRAAERYPRLVVTMHMGAEGRAAQRTPNAPETFYGENRGNMVAFARAAATAGADLVVGHGPHVMRAAEWHGETLVLYSLGNLLTYGPFSLAEPLNRGAVACAALDSTGRVVEAALRPTRQVPPGRVLPDLTSRAVALTDSLSRLDFPGSAARFEPDGAIVVPAPRTEGLRVRKVSPREAREPRRAGGS
ncbi:MAG TPA: CapA family protein [Longimicrobiaceae bacterium]|nr:CapA family protein [Longimicrobiaceae bacterium]